MYLTLWPTGTPVSPGGNPAFRDMADIGSGSMPPSYYTLDGRKVAGMRRLDLRSSGSAVLRVDYSRSRQGRVIMMGF